MHPPSLLPLSVPSWHTLSLWEHSAPDTLLMFLGAQVGPSPAETSVLCCYNQQWDLSAPLANPRLRALLPTCHFSCPARTH